MNVIDAYLKSVFGQGKYLIYMKIPQRHKISWESLVYKILKSLYR